MMTDENDLLTLQFLCHRHCTLCPHLTSAIPDYKGRESACYISNGIPMFCNQCSSCARELPKGLASRERALKHDNSSLTRTEKKNEQ